MINLDSIFKSRDFTFANKDLSSQGYGFSSGHVWMWELDCEESWALKNWWFFFSCFIFFIIFYFFLLYNIVLVLPYINMNPPRVYTCSQHWTPLPPPSPYHISGSSQCTSPKHPVSCIEPRIDAFELWCWRRLLRVPWTARRFNQSILKELSLGCSLEGMMLKLKLQWLSGNYY